MSLKCSLLGHAFDDPEIEREREEQGSEVVITIRETETCSRCGTERVVSENKEVTTLETPADIVEEETDAGATTTTGGEAESAATAPEPAGGAEPEPEPEPAGGVEEEVAVPDAETGSVGGFDAGPDATTDDGVILDEEGDAAGETEEPEQTGRTPGEWPEEPDDGDEEWTPETETAPEEPEVEQPGEAVTVPEGDFECPECGFTTPVEESSLREGDFCPECHRGALRHGGGD
jgi:ssDNA-binding Zn-finger/Zn-ribbon topoisomerase 1